VFVGTRAAFHGKKSTQGATIALDAATGKEPWRRNDIFPFTPLVSDGRVVARTAFASPNMRCHLLDVANGNTLWTTPRSAWPYACSR
jgi:outer membrane protein assembly factor BamB